MNNESIVELVKQIVFFSCLCSIVTFGLMQTFLKIVDKEELHRFVGIITTYIIGMVMGLMLFGDVVLWQKFCYGFFIGSTAIALYKSVVQSMLEIVPLLMKKFVV